jgi:hypothetical protein
MPPPSLSPYDTIHEDQALYKTKPRSDPTDQFFVAMRNLKSPQGTCSVMSARAQHAEMYMRACKIESYDDDGEVYNPDKLLVRPYDLIFVEEYVPKKFLFGKPFLMTAQLCKRPFPLKRLLLAVLKCIYLLPTYLYFMQDIGDRCQLLTSSTSFVELPVQEHRMMKKHHMDQNPYISSSCPKPDQE